MVTIEEKFIDLEIGRTRYLTGGAGAPLVLLHGVGYSNSANSFDTILPLLAERFQVFAIDQIGFGKSDRQVIEGPTFDQITDQLREFLDALALGPINLVGHSMGGWMAARLAYQSPDRVRRLVLLNAAGLNATIAPDVRQSAELPSVEVLIQQILEGLKEPSRMSGEMAMQLARKQREMLEMPNAMHSLDELLRIMKTAHLRKRYLLNRFIGKIQTPALVIWGHGDRMEPYPTWTAEYDELKGDLSRSSKPWTMPNAQYLLFDTGHFAHWELPVEVADQITNFMDTCTSCTACNNCR